MKRSIIIIIVLLQTLMGFAQKDKADEHFRLYQYEQAIVQYRKYMATKPGDYSAAKNLALACKLTNKINEAAEAYKVLINMKESTAEDIYQLVQMLRINGAIAEANRYAQAYQAKSPGEKAGNLLTALKEYDHYMQSRNDYVVDNKSRSDRASVYGLTKYKGQLLVTAENRTGKASEWTGRGYTDIFVTNGALDEYKPFAKEVMGPLDDGMPAFADNGNTMYFTTAHEQSLKEGSINTKKLKIATAQWDGKAWQKSDEFPYNSVGYSVVHPTISKNGDMLVFASDMPGGKGGMDLYYCSKISGKWSKPQNLANLNTSENELFPVFDQDDNLSFSSNGLPGLGGLDIFKATRAANGFGTPLNLRAPINSHYDDFCLYSEDNMRSGYLSTNRFGDPQIDNVAYFERAATSVSSQKIKLKIIVLDKYTRTPLPYVSVTVKDKRGQEFHKGLSDPAGQIVLDEIPVGAYSLQGMLNDVSTTIATVAEQEFVGTEIVKEILHNDPRFTLAGIAVNTKTRVPLAGVIVSCNNTAQGIAKKQTTAADGKFFFQLEQNSDFEVQGHKKGWLSSEAVEKTTKGLDRTTQLYVDIELKIEQPVSMGTIALRKIYYNYDKCDIRSDASVELNRLVKLLNDYPDMIIELASHTDSRGSDEYNLKLSQCRSESAVNYLLSQRIDKTRLKAKGYGETRLLNHCSNGVTCTDMQHEENRRTEFTILSCSSCPE